MTDTGDIIDEFLTGADSLLAPERGDLLRGVVISTGPAGLIIDLGMKRDGIIPHADLENLPPDESGLIIGDEVAVMVVDPVDHDGNLVVSIAQARESDDWLTARSLLESDEIIEAAATNFNRGGLLVPFGRLWGFVPASHLCDLPKGLEEEERKLHFSSMLGTKRPFKIIEVDPQRRRLVLSERKAIRQWRHQRKAQVIRSLKEGEIREGVVTSLREFGAFVDIGGADGLVHISEISWRRIEDPYQALEIGQEIKTLILRLDRENNRIALSLKRLQPNPWAGLDERIEVDQVLEGTITLITSNGIFILIEDQVEGLMKAGLSTNDLRQGDMIHVRVVSIDVEREKLELEPV
jgi:small subunit ribosomal protein S1